MKPIKKNKMITKPCPYFEPSDLPNTELYECLSCGGTGEIVHDSEFYQGVEECDECFGSGLIGELKEETQL